MPAAVSSTNHRTRVAAERRARMRRRLIESAMIVFAQKGIGASVIPDVVAAAEVSQGSFYNYFRTNEELLAAVSEELSNEMVLLIETVVGDIEDPALRVATAIRSYLHLARSYRVVARFLSSAGLSLAGKRHAIFEYLPPDIEEGQKRGHFDISALDVAVDLITGAGLVAVHRMANGRTAKDYPEKIVTAMLRSLGMTAALAARVTAVPLPKLTAPQESLLAQAQARLTARAGTTN
jgi:AcrR family transcriptional regulator